jgi:hypothetical protein
MIALTVLRNGLPRMMGGSYSSSPMSITFNLSECLIYHLELNVCRF